MSHTINDPATTVERCKELIKALEQDLVTLFAILEIRKNIVALFIC